MIDFHQALKKASRLDLSIWRRLLLLSLGAFLLGIATTFLEVGTVSLFLQKNTFYAIGVDFLFVALCLVWAGAVTVKLDRRNGYGGVPLTTFLTFILIVILESVSFFPKSSLPVNILFIYKYILPVIVSVSFWTIVSRFVILQFNSLKYLGLLAFTFIGFFSGGLFLSGHNLSPEETVLGSVFCFLGLAIIMKILVWLLPQPGETFIRKTGGVQDPSEQKMIDCILAMAFTYMTAKGLSDYLLYQHLKQQGNVFSILSYLWMNCGGIGFVILSILAYTRFLYTTLWGLCALCGGFFLLAEGAFLNVSWLLYSGFVVVWLCGFLYWKPYLSLLPRPLTLGIGIRLRKLRQMLMEPLGFVLVGALILTLPHAFLAQILALSSIILIGLIVLSVILYSHLLSRLCKMRLWCGGPLMLVSEKLVKKVKQGINSDSFQDVVYFLRIMEVAHFPGYIAQLLKVLHHPLEDVRLFALDKLNAKKCYKTKVVKAVQQVFQKDPSSLVRAHALAFLICSENDSDSQAIYHKYGSYLDDKNLKAGAITGFLKSGGEWALLAMDGLQKLVSSRHKSDNLCALNIIDAVPQEGLVRLVMPLLQSPHIEVVRSALLVAGHIGHAQTLSFIFQSLDNPELQEEALQALFLYEKKAFPPLEKMIQSPNVPFSRRKLLVLFLGLLPSGEGKQILLRNLYLLDQKMRKEVLSAVLNSKITWVSRSRKKLLKKGIIQDVQWWHLLNKQFEICLQVPLPALGDSFSFLRNAFYEMQQDLRELILDQLFLLRPTSLIKKTLDIFREKPSQKFVSAASILQDLLPRSVYKAVYPILLSPVVEIKEEGILPMDVEQAKHFLEQLVVNPPFPVNRWIVASALYGLQKVGDSHSQIVLEKAFLWPSPVVLEAGLELLGHLEPDAKKQTAYLSRQIHKMPKNIILEDYLNNRRKNDYL
ncbi:MAG: hypothetical protein IKQ99_01485 [Alphaproteobacteria bacterium]|nr:hypothetical protein [Alphaproteobacteria bacterium]